MSVAAKKTDVERTAIMLDLVHGRYLEPVLTHERASASIAHVVMEEVAPGTGWGASRYADVLALSVWPSRGFLLDGYEIKASRADLKRELADPKKHEALSMYCDSWSLVIWDEKMLEGVGPIPEQWGIFAVVETDGDPELRKVRKPTKLTPAPWTRALTCSLVRNAHQQSPRASYVARACALSHAEGRASGRRAALTDIDSLVRPLAVALYGDRTFDWATRKPDELIAAAVKLLGTPADRAAAAINRITGVSP